MVVIDIALWPGGLSARAKPLGHILICNDGTAGSAEFGNYQAVLKHGGHYYGKPGVWKSGCFKNFRRNQDVYVMVLRVLEACFSGAKDAQTPEHAKRLLAVFDREKADAPLLEQTDEVNPAKEISALKLEIETLKEAAVEKDELIADLRAMVDRFESTSPDRNG